MYPSCLRRRAMSSFIREVGIEQESCIARLALRIRLSMSAMGSVSTFGSSLLPARLRHARDGALVGELPQADAAEPELTEDRARAAAAAAARVLAHLEPLLAALLDTKRRLRHSLAVPSLGRERQAEAAQERERVGVRCRRSRDRDVQAPDRRDRVVVDLREDDLLADAERVVAAAVERLGVQPPEVANPRQRDRHEPVEELVHHRAAQRHLGADRHPLAQLETRDRLARAADLCALAGDRGQLLDRRVERLRVGLRVADAHVERDLLDARDLHDRGDPELVLQPGAELALVERLQTRRVGLGDRAHRSTSSPQPARLQTRTRTIWPFTSFSLVPTRVGSLQTGQTSITFETGTGAAFSTMPPGAICVPPIREA